MDEDQPWRPASLPSQLETAIANRTDESGRLTLRSLSNMIWGHVAAWMLLALAAVANNKAMLAGPDALTSGEAVIVGACMFGISVAALIFLGRTHVVVAEGFLTVRNPVRTYRLEMSAAESLDDGFWGFPRLRIQGGRSLRVFGLAESTKESMEGGGEDAFILRSLISERTIEGRRTGSQGVSRHWSVMSGSLVLLLAGWLAYVLAVTLL